MEDGNSLAGRAACHYNFIIIYLFELIENTQAHSNYCT